MKVVKLYSYVLSGLSRNDILFCNHASLIRRGGFICKNIILGGGSIERAYSEVGSYSRIYGIEDLVQQWKPCLTFINN